MLPPAPQRWSFKEAMSLFIDCHFLFEVQLLCFSLHVEVLSFEDSELSRGRYKMECQVEKLEHLRYILLFKFNRGAKAAEMTRNICVLHRDNAVGDSTATKRLSRFKEDSFDISNTPKTSRFNEDRLNTLIDNDPRQCTRKLACDEL